MSYQNTSTPYEMKKEFLNSQKSQAFKTIIDSLSHEDKVLQKVQKTRERNDKFGFQKRPSSSSKKYTQETLKNNPLRQQQKPLKQTPQKLTSYQSLSTQYSLKSEKQKKPSLLSNSNSKLVKNWTTLKNSNRKPYSQSCLSSPLSQKRLNRHIKDKLKDLQSDLDKLDSQYKTVSQFSLKEEQNNPEETQQQQKQEQETDSIQEDEVQEIQMQDGPMTFQSLNFNKIQDTEENYIEKNLIKSENFQENRSEMVKRSHLKEDYISQRSLTNSQHDHFFSKLFISQSLGLKYEAIEDVLHKNHQNVINGVQEKEKELPLDLPNEQSQQIEDQLVQSSKLYFTSM